MSCEARTRGGGEVLCAKDTFFSLLLNRTREARALCGFEHHKRESLFCFLFSDPIIVGLNVGLKENGRRRACLGKRLSGANSEVCQCKDH